MITKNSQLENEKIPLIFCEEEAKILKPHILEDTYNFFKVVFLLSPGRHEIRILDRFLTKNGTWTPNYQASSYILGLFDKPENALNALCTHFEAGILHNAYIITNPTNANFAYKEADYWDEYKQKTIIPWKITSFEKNSTKVYFNGTQDADISSIDSIVIDLDRPYQKGDSHSKGDPRLSLCSDDKELIALDQCRQAILSVLSNYDIIPSYQIMSGNGYQMGLYFDSQPNNAETRNCLKNFLEGLQALFPSSLFFPQFPSCNVDLAMSNPSRLSRIPGAINRKSERAERQSENRIYRLSKLVAPIVPSKTSFINLVRCFNDFLKPQMPKPTIINVPIEQKKKEANPVTLSFDDVKRELDSFIDRHKELSIFQKKSDSKTPYKITLKSCPWKDCHSSKSHAGEAFLAIIQNQESGKYETIFYCSHSHCQNPSKESGQPMTRSYPLLKALLQDTQTLCQYCKADIKILQGRPYNLDDTQHKCQAFFDNNKERKSKTSEGLGIDWHAKQIETITPETTNESSVSIKDVIDACNDKSILFLIAATGTRKTTTSLKKAVEDVANMYALVYPTIAEVNKVSQKLKALLLEANQKPENTMSIVVSSGIRQDKDQDEDDTKKNYFDTDKRIIVTTYAYLLRKGHSNKLYAIAKDMLKGRIVFCDEPQTFWSQLLISFPLFFRYHYKKQEKVETQYNKCESCLKHATKGNCANCHITAKHKHTNPLNRKEQTFEAFSEFQEKDFPSLQDDEIIINGESANNILDASLYSHISGTLFWKELENKKELSKEKLEKALLDGQAKQEKDVEISYKDFLESLLNTLYNPHLRIEAARKNNEMLTQKTLLKMAADGQDVSKKSGVQYPKTPCFCPKLCGVDVLPIAQLFNLSKQVIFLSATIPDEMLTVCREIASILGKEFLTNQLDKILTRFDVTFLKTTAKLSIDTLVSLITGSNRKQGLFKKTKKNIFIVLSTKFEAQNAYNKLSTFFPDDVVKFVGRDFEGQNFSWRTKDESHEEPTKRILITYGHSAITRAFDLPEYEIAIIDCALYIPMIAVALGIKKAKENPETLKLAILNGLKSDITQIIGRLLRTPLPQDDNPFDDVRKLVFLLYGLPEILLNETLIDTRLCHSIKEFSGKYIHPGNAENMAVVNSCLESILLAIKGEELKDQQIIYEQKKEKQKKREAEKEVIEQKKPLNKIAPSKRELAKEIRNIEQEKQDKERDSEHKLILLKTFEKEKSFVEIKERIDQELLTNSDIKPKDIINLFHLGRNCEFKRQVALVHYAQKIFEKELAQNPKLEYLQSSLSKYFCKESFEIQYAIKQKLEELKLKAGIDVFLITNPNATQKDIEQKLDELKLDARKNSFLIRNPNATQKDIDAAKENKTLPRLGDDLETILDEYIKTLKK